MNKMWYIHTMEYYFTIKRDKILIHAAAQKNHDNITPSERSQTQKDTQHTSPILHEMSGISKSIKKK